MKTCPECEGEKQFKLPSVHPLDVYNTEGRTRYEYYTCRTCKGKGEISDLRLAIYKARGGPAPSNPIQGF